MSFKGSKAGDKRQQWWDSISKEKLDALRWVMLHSGLNVGGLQNDDGFTGVQVAAAGDKPKALLVILDILRQKRELSGALEVASNDARGMVRVWLAACRAAGARAAATARSAAGRGEQQRWCVQPLLRRAATSPSPPPFSDAAAPGRRARRGKVR